MPHFINSNCTKCGACISECPTGSIAEGKDVYVIDIDTCADHAFCVSVCPVEAIAPLPVDKSKALEEEEE
ncbi:MAG: hypothetical protein A2583_02040 [Bdellovibrionales bacterium RIFOXYD1_FULL_53_11]|nr:MAG: hypothetical protein A2583_02040 [Bdellovibrionales bacterium RIFOXYD1_FULL_53_11]